MEPPLPPRLGDRRCHSVVVRRSEVLSVLASTRTYIVALLMGLLADCACCLGAMVMDLIRSA